MLRHPSSLHTWESPDQGASSGPARHPQLVTASLVLLAAAFVLEGYRWLDLIQSGRLYPPAAAFAVLVVPAVMFLTRPPPRSERLPADRVAVVAAGGLAIVTLVELLSDRPWSARLLGAYDLLCAAVILGVAFAGAGSMAT